MSKNNNDKPHSQPSEKPINLRGDGGGAPGPKYTTPFSEKCSYCIFTSLSVYVHTSCPDTVLDSSFREASPRLIKSRIMSFWVPL